jgi:hypothetical protein
MSVYNADEIVHRWENMINNTTIANPTSANTWTPDPIDLPFKFSHYGKTYNRVRHPPSLSSFLSSQILTYRTTGSISIGYDADNILVL